MVEQNRVFEEELKDKLNKQAQEHRTYMQDMLALQKHKLLKQYDLALRERLIHERHLFLDIISKNLAKVHGLGKALEGNNFIKYVIMYQFYALRSRLKMHCI